MITAGSMTIFRRHWKRIKNGRICGC